MEEQTGPKTLINNAFYDTLSEGWYTAQNHPVALLRAENRLRTPWVIGEIKKRFLKASVLDVGCGAGFLTNALAMEGFETFGIDLSKESLAVAKKFDETKTVDYRYANAYALPFPDERFDVVSALDVLEHVEEPNRLISEASRVLKPGGLFFFHTFNRNLLSYLIIIKGVDWFVQNAPKHMHVYPLFIKPKELNRHCEHAHLKILSFRGMRPNFLSRPFWKMLLTRELSDEFSFCFSKSLTTGYCGIAEKE